MMALSLLIFPLIASLLVLVSPKKIAIQLASFFAVIQLAITAFAYYLFKTEGATAFNIDCQWIKNPNIHFNLTMDGVAMLMIGLTSICIPFIIYSLKNKETHNIRTFLFLILLMQCALTGVFLANDGILYYVFWELTLIPAYFILMFWGGENRSKITVKFFIYTLAGSLFMMIGFISIYHLAGNGQNMSMENLRNLNLPEAHQKWIFIAFMVAFAIKIPLLPFHTWQADTYKVAPNQGTMLLAALMAKMGLFSIARWVLPVFPIALSEYTEYIMWICGIGVVYASIIAIQQKDIKRLFAYASLAHMSIMTAGIFSNTHSGFEGAFVQAFAHGIYTIGLFVCVDIIQNRIGTTELSAMGGIRKSAPKFVTAFFVVMFAVIAVPFTNSFIGEVVVLFGIFEYNPWIALLACSSLILGSVYMMRMFRISVLGETNEKTENFMDLSTSEKWVLYPVVLLILIFGIWYQPLFELSKQTADTLFGTHLIVR